MRTAANVMEISGDLTPAWERNAILASRTTSDHSIRPEPARLGTWDLDLRTRTLTWFRSVTLRRGDPRGESVSSFDAFLSVVHTADRKRLTSAIYRASVEGTDFEHKFRMISGDDSERWIEIVARIVPDASGHPARLVGIAVDVTEYRADLDARALSELVDAL